MNKFLTTSKRVLAGALASLLILTSLPEAALDIHAKEGIDSEYGDEMNVPASDVVTPVYAVPEAEEVSNVGISATETGTIPLKVTFAGAGAVTTGDVDTLGKLTISEEDPDLGLTYTPGASEGEDGSYVLEYSIDAGTADTAISFNIAGILDPANGFVKDGYTIADASAVTVTLNDEGSDDVASVTSLSADGTVLTATFAQSIQSIIRDEDNNVKADWDEGTIDLEFTIARPYRVPVNVTFTGDGVAEGYTGLNKVLTLASAATEGSNVNLTVGEPVGGNARYYAEFTTLTSPDTSNAFTIDLSDAVDTVVKENYAISNVIEAVGYVDGTGVGNNDLSYEATYSRETNKLVIGSTAGFNADFATVQKIDLTIPVTRVLSIPMDITFEGDGVKAGYTDANKIPVVKAGTGSELEVAYNEETGYTLAFPAADTELAADKLVLDFADVLTDTYLKDGYSITAVTVAKTADATDDTTVSFDYYTNGLAQLNAESTALTITEQDGKSFGDAFDLSNPIAARTNAAEKLYVTINVATLATHDVTVNRKDLGIGAVQFKIGEDAPAALTFSANKATIAGVDHGKKLTFPTIEASEADADIPAAAKFVLISDNVIDHQTPEEGQVSDGLEYMDIKSVIKPAIDDFNDAREYEYTIKSAREIDLSTASIEAALPAECDIASIVVTDGEVAQTAATPDTNYVKVTGEDEAYTLYAAATNAPFKFTLAATDGNMFSTNKAGTIKGVKSVYYVAAGESEPVYLYNITADADDNILDPTTAFAWGVVGGEPTQKYVNVSIPAAVVAQAVEDGATSIVVEPLTDQVYSVTLKYYPEYDAEGVKTFDAVDSGLFNNLKIAVGTETETFVETPTTETWSIVKANWEAVYPDDDDTKPVEYYTISYPDIPKDSRVVVTEAAVSDGYFAYIGATAADKKIFEYVYADAYVDEDEKEIPASQTSNILIDSVAADVEYYIDAKSVKITVPEAVIGFTLPTTNTSFTPNLTAGTMLVNAFTTTVDETAPAYGTVQFTASYDADDYTLEDFSWSWTDAEGEAVSGSTKSFVLYDATEYVDEEAAEEALAELKTTGTAFYTTSVGTGNAVTNTYYMPEKMIIDAMDKGYDIQLDCTGIATRLLTIDTKGLSGIEDNVFVKYTVYYPDALTVKASSPAVVTSGDVYKKVTEWTPVGESLAIEVPYSTSKVSADSNAKYVGSGHVVIDAIGVMDEEGAIIAGPILVDGEYYKGNNNANNYTLYAGKDFQVGSDGIYSAMTVPQAVEPDDDATEIGNGYVDKAYYPDIIISTDKFILNFIGYAGQVSTLGAAKTAYNAYVSAEAVPMITVVDAANPVDTSGVETTTTDPLVSEVTFVSGMSSVNDTIIYAELDGEDTKLGEIYTGAEVVYTPATTTPAADEKWALSLPNDVKFTVNSATQSESAVYGIREVELQLWDTDTSDYVKDSVLTPDSDGVYTIPAATLKKLLKASDATLDGALYFDHPAKLVVTQTRKAAAYQTVRFTGDPTDISFEEWQLTVVDENGTIYKNQGGDNWTYRLPSGMNMVVTATLKDDVTAAYNFISGVSNAAENGTIKKVTVAADAKSTTIEYTVPNDTDAVTIGVEGLALLKWTQGDNTGYAVDGDTINVIYNKDVVIEYVEGTTAQTIVYNNITGATGTPATKKYTLTLNDNPAKRGTVTVTLGIGENNLNDPTNKTITFKTSDPDEQGALINGKKSQTAALTGGAVATYPLSITDLMEINEDTVVVFDSEGKSINNEATTPAQYNSKYVTASIADDVLTVNTRGGSAGTWTVVILDKNNKTYGEGGNITIGTTTLSQVKDADAIAGSLTVTVTNPEFAKLTPGAVIKETSNDSALLALTAPSGLDTSLNDVYYQIDTYKYDAATESYGAAVASYVPISDTTANVALSDAGQYKFEVRVIQDDIANDLGNTITTASYYTTAVNSKGTTDVEVAGEEGGVYETKLKLAKGAGWAKTINNQNDSTLAIATAKWSKTTTATKLAYVELVNGTNDVVYGDSLDVSSTGKSRNFERNDVPLYFGGIGNACTIYVNPKVFEEWPVGPGKYTIKAYAYQGATGAPNVTATMPITVVQGITDIELTTNTPYVYTSAKKATIKTSLKLEPFDDAAGKTLVGDKKVTYYFVDDEDNHVASLNGMTINQKKGSVTVPKGTPIGEYTIAAVAPYPTDDPEMGVAKFEVLNAPAAISSIEINDEAVTSGEAFFAGEIGDEANIKLYGTVNGDTVDITSGYTIKVTGAAKGNSTAKFVKPGTATITCTPLGNLGTKTTCKITLKASAAKSDVALYSNGDFLLDESLENEEGWYNNPSSITVTNYAGSGEYVWVGLRGTDEVDGIEKESLTSDTVKVNKGGKIKKTELSANGKGLYIIPNAAVTTVTVTNKTTGTNMTITINNAAIKKAKTDTAITVDQISANGVLANSNTKGTIYNNINFIQNDEYAAELGFATYEELIENNAAPNVVTYKVNGAIASEDGKKYVRVYTTSPLIASALDETAHEPVDGTRELVTKGQTIYGQNVDAGEYNGAYIIELDENDSFVVAYAGPMGYSNFKKGTYSFSVTSIGFDAKGNVVNATKSSTVKVKAVAAPSSKITFNTKLKYSDTTSCSAPLTVKKSNVSSNFITLDPLKVGQLRSANNKGVLNKFPTYFTVYMKSGTANLCYNYGTDYTAKVAKQMKILNGYAPVAYRNADGSIAYKYIKVSITAKNGLHYYPDSNR